MFNDLEFNRNAISLEYSEMQHRTDSDLHRANAYVNHMEAGKNFKRKKKWSQAIKEFSLAAKCWKYDASANYKAALCHEELGQYAQAYELYIGLKVKPEKQDLVKMHIQSCDLVLFKKGSKLLAEGIELRDKNNIIEAIKKLNSALDCVTKSELGQNLAKQLETFNKQLHWDEFRHIVNGKFTNALKCYDDGAFKVADGFLECCKIDYAIYEDYLSEEENKQRDEIDSLLGRIRKAKEKRDNIELQDLINEKLESVKQELCDRQFLSATRHMEAILELANKITNEQDVADIGYVASTLISNAIFELNIMRVQFENRHLKEPAKIANELIDDIIITHPLSKEDQRDIFAFLQSYISEFWLRLDGQNLEQLLSGIKNLVINALVAYKFFIACIYEAKYYMNEPIILRDNIRDYIQANLPQETAPVLELEIFKIQYASSCSSRYSSPSTSPIFFRTKSVSLLPLATAMDDEQLPTYFLGQGLSLQVGC